MKGVVMLLAGYHPYIGGAEGQARSVASHLKRRGIPVWVATRRLPGLPKVESIDDIAVHRLPSWGPGPIGSLVFMVSSFLHFCARRSDYDVIHAHLASSHAVAAAAAGRLLDKRVLVKLGGGKGFGEIALSKRTFLGQLKLKALRLLKPVLVAVNQDILTEIPGTALEGLETAVISNGVDLTRFQPPTLQEKAALRHELGWKDGFVLLSTSRLAQDKQVGLLLERFLETWAKSAPPGAILCVAGTGPEEAALRSRAQALGAPVVFLGPRDDLPRLYRSADAFLLPSISEGLSNALLEAMACGLPVLATRVTGTTGLVRDGENGLLYDPWDASGLETRLDRLPREPGLLDRLGRAARQTAEGFSLEATVERWIELYTEAKESKGKQPATESKE